MHSPRHRSGRQRLAVSTDGSCDAARSYVPSAHLRAGIVRRRPYGVETGGMADEQPEEQAAPLLRDRSLLMDVVSNFEKGAAAGTAVYGLHKAGRVVSKVKDKATAPKDEPPKR
jgi:hypothetical protein